MEWQVALNNNSFDRAGITKDCKEAICEYIWNSFEAGASKVEISFTGEQMQEAMAIRVSDNGSGIDFDTLKDTFGAFLSSIKNSSTIRIKSQANKGKGRFSYLSFSYSAEWDTVYKKDGVLNRYTISTSQINKSNFSTSVLTTVAEGTETGTVVEFPLVDGNTIDQLSYTNMHQKLLQEFSWYLYLNKKKSLSLVYNGITLDYTQYVDSDLSIDTEIEIEGQKFSVSLIVWKKNIDNSSMIYYLSDTGEIHAARNTGFNKNTVGFFHNVFVVSDFITTSNTAFLQKDNDAPQLIFDFGDGSKKIYGELKKEINKLIAAALKNFLIKQANQKLIDMEERGSFPKFPEDEYGQLRRKDFETVTKELYCVEPKIFYKLNDKQEKSLLGFMNLLLSSEERENLLGIIEQVVSLTSDQRQSFADILKRTKLQFIVETIGIIEKRMDVIGKLKQIVYDMTHFANERDHIQKIIEQHFWLFGEQYHLLTADKTLASSLEEYEKILQSSSTGKKKKAKGEASQRADIFLYTQRVQENSESEMVIIELKAPAVCLSEKVFGQIVRYANTIRKEARFNGANRIWRFYAICASIDDDVKTKFENFKQHGRLGLANVIGNFEIYALTWDDVFQSFEARHDFMLSHLKTNLSIVSDSLEGVTDEQPSRERVNSLTRELVETEAR